MATIYTWRKAYGALKDHTKVGLAHVNSDFKDVDVAIVKATNHVECPPKERHLKKILAATSVMRPRAHVAYCLHALARRLEKTHNWTVALKTLIVIHKTLREGNPTFRDELLNLQRKGHILQLSNFKDDSSPIAWDCSAWVRTYGVFLEERLQCFRTLKYDIEAECLAKPRPGQESYSRTKELDGEELLEQLPALQQLLYRLIGCRPEGAAASNYVIQYALALVLKESFKLYCAIYDGIINLIDKFFEMPRHEAIKALDIYKRASEQAGSLSDFYEVCKEMELARSFQFPILKEPPQSFLVTMEDYVREAPKTVSLPTVTLEYPERLQLAYKTEEVLSPSEDTNLAGDKPNPPPLDGYAVSNVEDISPFSNDLDAGDLWRLNVTPPDASTTEDSNASGLAMVSSDMAPSFDAGAIQTKDLDPTEWELALIATSCDISSSNGKQLADGVDSPAQDSLYEEAAYRTSQQPVNGVPAPNPFEEPYSFSVSSNIAHSPAVQMADMTQQQPNNPFAPYQHAYPQLQEQQHSMIGPQNPFDESELDMFPANVVANHQTNNPFGSTGLD